MDFSPIKEKAGVWAQQGADWARAWLIDATTIHATGFEDRVVETALKIQIGFLLFLALVAPLGGMRLEPAVALVVLVQAALTYLALVRTRRRDPVLGGGLYLTLAAVTFFEAKSYSGIVGAIFSFEAVLSLIASYYIVALIRRRSAARRAERERIQRRGAPALLPAPREGVAVT